MNPWDDPFWRPATHGAKKRHWSAARFAGREWARNKAGNIIWVSNFKAAQELADRLNSNEA